MSIKFEQHPSYYRRCDWSKLMEVPPTIQALRNLRPGESLVFFKGDFPPYDNRGQTPIYDGLLHRIFSEARFLETEGRIMIREGTASKMCMRWKGKNCYEERVFFKTWTATGLPRPSVSAWSPILEPAAV